MYKLFFEIIDRDTLISDNILDEFLFDFFYENFLLNCIILIDSDLFKYFFEDDFFFQMEDFLLKLQDDVSLNTDIDDSLRSLYFTMKMYMFITELYGNLWPFAFISQDGMEKNITDNKFHNLKGIKDYSVVEPNYYIFSSYLINENDLQQGNLRLLEVDNPLYLPRGTHIDLLITSDDVLHSWTIPSFGLKCDAVPGRLNHANLFVERQNFLWSMQ